MAGAISGWNRAQDPKAPLRQDLDDNATLYGKKLENREIVTKGVCAPKEAAKRNCLAKSNG